MGTVISGLLIPKLPQYDGIGTTLSAIDAAGGISNLQTRLLALQQAKRAQEAEALMYQRIQQDPRLLLGGDDQSVLGSLHAPGGGAITQQTMRPADALMGTAPTGGTQTVPTYPDLSQFATGQPAPTLA